MDYYEQILKMDGAGGIPRSSTFKHMFKRGFVAAAPSRDAAAPDDEEHANGGEGDGQAPDATAEDGADADTTPRPAAAAPAAASPAAEAEEVDDGRKKGGKGGVRARGRGAAQ